MRRHWQLVCCAFSFCWWAYGHLPTEEVTETRNDAAPVDSAGRGKKESQAMLAGDAQGSKGVVGALHNAQSILEGVFCGKPPPRELEALLERVFSGRGLYLYVH